ncbi:hypothetical protein E4U21_006314 [Claviceps maximensis]|nr:hypothetical protein E4U21_006314 [Claviceps maximensis]
MVGSKRNVSTRSSKRAKKAAEPDIYEQMLVEAGVSGTPPSPPQRPPKRRRPNADADAEQDVGRKIKTPPRGEPVQPALSGNIGGDDEDSDEDVEFQDVILPTPTVQTMELDSDDDDSDDDDDDDNYGDKDTENEEDNSIDSTHLNSIDFTAPVPNSTPAPNSTHHLELNLTAHQAASTSPFRRQGERRKPLSRAERDRRIHVHQAHLLCLLSHVARRNHWCNDARAQDALRPQLSDKTVQYLTPSAHLPQFGQAESLKKGLEQSMEVWRTRFVVTERGIRRALWAEDVMALEDYSPPSDMDSCLDRAEFLEASKRLQGSRDVGAQLYCAMLRGVGVRTRLVCSLQPLACTSSAPTLPKPNSTKYSPKVSASPKARAQDALAKYEALAAASTGSASSAGACPGRSLSTARRRLGHPNATAYNFQPPVKKTAAPAQRTPHIGEPIRIHESAHPVYWVEVLDKGHQKWQPVDPMVTHSFWKPKVFEPPITDKENSLSYVVAFEADGTAKDVTRRYAKAYTAKSRKLRVETALKDSGEWWRRAMKPFRRRQATDLDQIEDSELAGLEAREPMPKNVQDFKDHPVYALERHLRRHEVLVAGARPSGTITAGSRGRGPPEKIYRRKDVRMARSADKWYRMGRQVKANEIPVKWLPRRAARPRDKNGRRYDDDDVAGAGADRVPLFTTEQTSLYEPPPVRDGRVPKNKFGNIDAYVPSMIPRGGVHIPHEQAARAAFLAGVDYAPALTGFSFQGRHGTAVLRGVVVAEEFGEAIWAVLAGMADAEHEAEGERRALAARRIWRRLLMGLRIRERIWSRVGEEERREAEAEAEAEAAGGSETTEEFDMEFEEDGDEGGGGGFLLD